MAASLACANKNPHESHAWGAGPPFWVCSGVSTENQERHTMSEPSPEAKPSETVPVCEATTADPGITLTVLSMRLNVRCCLPSGHTGAHEATLKWDALMLHALTVMPHQEEGSGAT